MGKRRNRSRAALRARHLLEAAFAYPLYALFAALPVDAASAIGGRLGRLIGPRLGASRKALRNLARAMPELSDGERRAIVAGMWENLGRVVAEYPHLSELAEPGRIEWVGAEHVDAFATVHRPGLVFSAHLANWEAITAGTTRRGLPLTLVYRQPNNPYVDRLVARARRAFVGTLVPKGTAAAREIAATLKRGGHVGLLVDQKLNRGMAVPFFGRDAMTAPAIAQFALRFDCPILPMRIVRTRGARFRIEAFPPFRLDPAGDRDEAVRAALARINATVEAWIREHPEQWLWLHRRWPD